MAQQMQTRRSTRQASPERWQKAAQRAIAEGVRVAQLNDSGAWVATSGTDSTVAYLVEVTNGIVHGCTCPAGQHGDPVCKHRALWLYHAGLLDPEPDPPALGAPVVCFRCRGADPACPVCASVGMAALATQAAAATSAAA